MVLYFVDTTMIWEFAPDARKAVRLALVRVKMSAWHVSQGENLTEPDDALV